MVATLEADCLRAVSQQAVAQRAVIQVGLPTPGNITYSGSTNCSQGTHTDEFFPIEAKEAWASGESQGTQTDNKSPAE